MRSSPDFEMHALMIFAVVDDVVENLDGDVDTMIEKLESVARLHAKAEGFSSEFFQVVKNFIMKCIFKEMICKHNMKIIMQAKLGATRL